MWPGKTLKYINSVCVAFVFTMFCAVGAYGQISTPKDINGLVFWVDATDVNGNGVQPTNGSAVTTWVDKSSGGNNLTTAGGTVTFEATGFDGVKPGLRFPLNAHMDAANVFSGNTQSKMTVFFVTANVTRTDNFALTLNGHNTGTNIADGRFSFHTPWTNDNLYFDAGACCGPSRLSGVFPNATTETTLFTGLNNQAGNSQLLRVDGQVFQSDATGHNANVSRGIHVGDLPSSHTYNGRFAEILVYDSGLAMSQIKDIECYLLLKWKISAAPPGCAVKVTAAKTVLVWDPDADGLYAVPGNDVIYTIKVTHESGPALDAGSVFIAEKLPSDVIFYNGDIDDAGPETNPVSFPNNNSSLTFNYATDIKYSNAVAKPANMAACTYTPTAGYDPAVKHICIKPTGTMNAGTPNPSFEVSFRTRIK